MKDKQNKIKTKKILKHIDLIKRYAKMPVGKPSGEGDQRTNSG